MKSGMLLLLFVFSTAALAGQKVWLNGSKEQYDPASLNDSPVYYIYLPLEKAKNDDRFRVRLFYPNGQLAIEGLSPDPAWSDRTLLGEVQTYYRTGDLQSRAHYLLGQDNCNCQHVHAVNDGESAVYFPNGQLKYKRQYEHGTLVDADYQEFDEAGHVSRKYTIVDGHYQGMVQDFEEQSLVQQVPYENGKRNGKLIRYAHDKPVIEAMYKDGKRHGVEKSYEDGQLVAVYQYEEGKKRGEQKQFYPNGTLKHIRVAGPYAQSIGEERWFNEEGTLTRFSYVERDDTGAQTTKTEKRYTDDGKLSSLRIREGAYRLEEDYDENGQLTTRSERDKHGKQGLFLRTSYGLERAHYLNNKLHGKYRKESGDFKSFGHFIHGKRDGDWVEIDSRGRRTETAYNNGARHGKYQVFDQHGKRIRYANYVNDELDGQVKIENDYGELIRAEYDSGTRVGVFERYSHDGRLLEKGQYDHGEPVGAHYTFDTNGRMESKKSYRDGKPDGEWLETNYNGEVVRREIYQQGERVK